MLINWDLGFLMVFGYLKDRFMLGLCWGHVGVILGSFQGRFRVILVAFRSFQVISVDFR